MSVVYEFITGIRGYFVVFFFFFVSCGVFLVCFYFTTFNIHSYRCSVKNFSWLFDLH